MKKLTFKKVYPPFDPAKHRSSHGLLIVAGIPVKMLRPEDVPFFYQSTFPQYRKRITTADGEEIETHLDGTETDDTVIVKYDYNEDYKKWRDTVMREAMKDRKPE